MKGREVAIRVQVQEGGDRVSALTTELAEILGTVLRPGDFYATGTTDVYAPGLEVEGVGPIALPLLPSQAAQLIAAAERAPYGRGEETLVDTAVRRGWQNRAGQGRLLGGHWGRRPDAIFGQTAEGLGGGGAVGGGAHKLLGVGEGGVFL